VKPRYNRESVRERERKRVRIGGERDGNSSTLQLEGICIGPASPFVLPPLITLLLEGRMNHGASTYHVLRMEERSGSALPPDNDVCAGV
jgi:hypothetical protein